MTRRFQFTLRSLLTAMLIAAVACAVWTWLPSSVQRGIGVAAVIALVWIIGVVCLFVLVGGVVVLNIGGAACFAAAATAIRRIRTAIRRPRVADGVLRRQTQ